MRHLSVLAFAAISFGCEAPVVNVVSEGRCTPAAGEVVRPASAFLDTLGLSMSLADVGDLGPDGRPVTSALAELGIRHVQSGTLSAQEHGARVQAVIKSGIRPVWRLGRNTDVASFLQEWAGFVPVIILPDPDDVTSSSTFKWPEALQKARAVREVVLGLPAAERPQIIGFRLSSLQDVMMVGDISELVEFGGFRSSIPPQPPEDSFGTWFTMAQSLASQRPLVATFVGYNGGPATTGITRDSEAEQAKYLMRVLLESFNQGIVRSYYSQLFDNCDGCNGGLIRIDGTPKPAYVAWQTLVKLLAANATLAPLPPQLSFTVESSGNDQSKLHHTLMARADGTVVMLLWLEGRRAVGEVMSTIKLRVMGTLESASLGSLLVPGTNISLDPTMPLSIPVSDMPVPLLLRPACRE